MCHIEKCRNLCYATLKVPEALREQLGRTKFKQTLGSADKRRAQELAKPLVALWKAKLREAEGEPDAVQAEALRWRETLAALKREGDEEALSTLEDVATSKAEAIEEKHGTAKAVAFADVALGRATPSRLHYDEWAASSL